MQKKKQFQQSNNRIKTYNGELISKSIEKRLNKTNKMPSLTQISQDTGISRQTIAKHLKEMKLSNKMDKYRFITDDVMTSVRRAIDAGNAQAMKLFFQLAWDWKPPKMNDTAQHQQHQQVIYEIRGEDPPSKEELAAREKERLEWQERIAKSELDKQQELDDLFFNDSNSGKWMPDDPGTL